ncbi:MAG TPA: hypothetical protein VMV94_13910 [Phycisphaerae bacterium]|nr:hypothetical protein [Phycisphaerae bacterium]
MKSRNLIWASLLFIVPGMLPSQLAAQVDGRILRVGLFAGARPLVRTGDWSFVEVDLRYTGSAPFDGELRVDQLDVDGDVVTSVQPVALANDGQWRSYQVYFVPRDTGVNQAVQVRLFDSTGRLVRVTDESGRQTGELLSPPFGDMAPDEVLIVDLTMPRKLPHREWLTGSQAANRAGGPNARVIRELSPRELPFRWQGLEPVDAIIWDDADPTALSLQQVDALVNWVKAGGRLLITAGANWQALSASPLAAALPAKITGAGQSGEAQEFLEIVRNDVLRNYLERCYVKKAITRCSLEPLPGVLPIPADCELPQIAFRRLMGRGAITFIGAPLRQLLPVPRQLSDPGNGDPAEPVESSLRDVFISAGCEELLGRGFLSLPEVRKEENSPWNAPADLFQYACDSVSFATSSAAYLIFAVFFAIAYTIFAAGGSYWYLTRRSWQHHCWTAFAVVSVAGSVISTAMVWTLRGFKTTLWQTTVIDAYAGADYGYANCLFGVKTPNHQRLDLRLTAENGSADLSEEPARDAVSLRPMPQPTGSFVNTVHFVAPENYQSLLIGSALNGVKIRATLKEFQGCWEGPLGGKIEAKLIARKSNEAGTPYRFTEGSFIRNRLGTTLRDCYLLETRTPFVRQAAWVNCWPLGTIPASGKDAEIDAKRLAELLYFEKGADGTPVVPEKPVKKVPRLDEAIGQWRSAFGGIRLTPGAPDISRGRLAGDTEYHPLYLLSVFNLLEGDDPKTYGFRRSHARLWDCIDQLSDRTAILIGHTEDAPPVALEVDQAGLRPAKARTVYRIVIPVEREKQ